MATFNLKDEMKKYGNKQNAHKYGFVKICFKDTKTGVDGLPYMTGFGKLPLNGNNDDFSMACESAMKKTFAQCVAAKQITLDKVQTIATTMSCVINWEDRKVTTEERDYIDAQLNLYGSEVNGIKVGFPICVMGK